MKDKQEELEGAIGFTVAPEDIELDPETGIISFKKITVLESSIVPPKDKK